MLGGQVTNWHGMCHDPATHTWCRQCWRHMNFNKFQTVTVQRKCKILHHASSGKLKPCRQCIDPAVIFSLSKSVVYLAYLGTLVVLFNQINDIHIKNCIFILSSKATTFQPQTSPDLHPKITLRGGLITCTAYTKLVRGDMLVKRRPGSDK